MKKLTLSLLVCASLISTAVFAAGHPYLDFQVGYGMRNTGDMAGADTKLNGAAGHVGAGYLFKLNDYVTMGPEVGYLALSDSKYTVGNETARYSGDAIDLGLKVVIHEQTPWYIFVKLGSAYVKQDLKAANGSTYKSHKYLPEAAGGIGYSFTKYANLYVAATHIFGENGLEGNIDRTDNKVASISLYAIGFTYNF